ncbi:ribosome maturation factor RimP [Bacilliculturomica massiliensis]|uniref:ribosome maturation factor RimP n=1 Tax=Bacilliculturomica massiliensis TaxID=1917867 RepID=UPI00103211D0|nr:ribosome maturation factor RimP [Bacilliculturomica massiliensis]
MAKKKIAEIVSEVLSPFLNENGYELFNVEFLKEGRDWFLRVYIEKTENGEYVSVGTDDCEAVSRFLSAELDRLDPIEQNYYLEVSSPGMDRPLLREKDFIRFGGEIVDVSLYKALDGRKTLSGTLVGRAGGCIIIKDEKGNEVKIPEEQVSKTRLAVVF